MAHEEQIGTIPFAALAGKRSPSMERANRAVFARELRMSPLERMVEALRLGQELKRLKLNHGHDRDPIPGD